MYVEIGHRPLGRCPIPIGAIYKSIVIISRPPIIGRAAFLRLDRKIFEKFLENTPTNGTPYSE